MILSPFTAYRLAAQAEAAHVLLSDAEQIASAAPLGIKAEIVLARLRHARKFAEDQASALHRLHTDLAAANAKLARMTGNLKRGPNKPVVAA